MTDGLFNMSPEAKQALNQMLRHLNFRTEVFYRGQLCDSWALDTSGSGNVNFHMVCHGDCWLHLPGSHPPTFLKSGDIVIFPDDAEHIIGSAKEKPLAYKIQQISKQIPMDKTSPGTALICGYIEVDQLVRQLMLCSLPEFIVLAGDQQPGQQAVRALLELLFSEAQQDQVGVSAILDRLADAILLYLIRDLASKALPISGLIGALADDQIAKAVVAIHEQPGEHWTLDKLAARAFLSRSVFADRFLQACGMPPIEFLTLWRMYLARRWLERDKLSVTIAAERCGYESVAAFSKAFKRVLGVGPGQFRKKLAN